MNILEQYIKEVLSIVGVTEYLKMRGENPDETIYIVSMLVDCYG